MPDQPPNRPSPSDIRSFTFGIEDSLVSTVGLLAGIAAAGVGRGEILLTGLVLIAVEAFSMGVGSVLSENAATEYAARADLPLQQSARSGLVMFSSYLLAGFVPLAPYLLLPRWEALITSISLSLAGLFALGLTNAKLNQRPALLRHGLEMLALGGVAVAVGVVVGKLVSLP